MKKIVGIALISLMALLIVPVNAQVSFGVKGGLNISSVHFNNEIVSSENITGFNIGPMLEIMVPYVGVGVDAAILYSQKGMANAKMKDASKIGADQGTDYIDIPVNFKWKFGLPVVKGYLAAGPYASFKVAGEKVWKIPGMIDSEFETKSFAAGLNFGLGAEVLRHIQVGFNYELGLTNNYSGVNPVSSLPDNQIEGKHRGWTISAAILF
ncbi:MAG: PorT family protein [Tannerellaceae bacterium]|jgi:hypothetical protein|nr:PorT family protein [Tannerellaceae bacterium]